MSSNVEFWWNSLCIIATFNIAMWCWSAYAIAGRRGELRPRTWLIRRTQLLLSGVYVFGCAFRSYFPVYDIPRLTLSQSWIANVLVGRSVATAAELCFAAQWVLLMRELHARTGSRIARTTARVVLPMIVVAEFCSWYSVLTTANIGHVLEESLWGVSAALLTAALISSLPRIHVRFRLLCYAFVMTAGAYALYMFVVDVPMYWTRWLAQQAQQHNYFTITQGIMDAAQRRVVSHNWHVWQSEVVWMSVYFSVAVWLSIILAHIPAPALVYVRKFQVQHSIGNKSIGAKTGSQSSPM